MAFFFKFRGYLLLFFLCLIFTGCSSSCSFMTNKNEKETNNSYVDINILTWNVQTFFDAEECGTEYDEFIGSKSLWTVEKYQQRVKRLCSILEDVNSDICVLIEVENENVLRDITNYMKPGNYGNCLYPYAGFCKEEGGACGMAILSKLNLEYIRVHQNSTQDFIKSSKTFKSTSILMRPIMEVGLCTTNSSFKSLNADNINEQLFFTLFINHWKSKIGEALETESIRTFQESVLGRLTLESLSLGRAVISCGDFNKDLTEFKPSSNKASSTNSNVSFKTLNSYVDVYSPWKKTSFPGSYRYNGKWEKIDHFFFTGNVACINFLVLDNGKYADENGYPIKYDISTGEGYSDHLPLFCTARVFKGDRYEVIGSE